MSAGRSPCGFHSWQFSASSIFGAAVNVDFIDPEVPFAEAWASVVWKWSIPEPHRAISVCVLATSFIGLILHSLFRNWKIRVVVMAIGFLVPVFSIGVVMLWVAVVSPLMVYSALAGRVDGEFYCEGMLMIAAIGLWMLQCLVSGVVDFVRRPRMRCPWRVLTKLHHRIRNPPARSSGCQNFQTCIQGMKRRFIKILTILGVAVPVGILCLYTTSLSYPYCLAMESHG